MVQFWVNGESVTTEERGSLLLFLRNRLHLTALKCGCMQGACGTCTVILDGKAVRSCIYKVENLGGAHILTPEGLSEREQEVYSYAFAAAGAVQCGYCLPSMLMSAKVLLDANPAPTEGEIRAAIDNNICRCTGYEGIIRAVLTAAKLLRTGEAVPSLPAVGAAGESPARIDAKEKILGTLKYVGDDIPADALIGAIKTAGIAHARIRAIDTSAALAMEGVAAVLTAADVPGTTIAGWLHGKWPILVGEGEEVRFAGDVVALVAAENETIARAAAKAIVVDYEALPPVLSPDEALAENAPQLYEKGNLFLEVNIHRGDRFAARANTVHEVRGVYDTPFAEHGFLELEAALAMPHRGRMLIRSADQAIFLTRKMVAGVLNVAEEDILVEGYPVGGAFGGREDVLIQAQAALLAQRTNRAVFLQYTRTESHLIHAKKHPMRIAVSSGCDAEGNLTYLDIDLLADKGAYPSLGGPVLERACSMAPGPYRYQAVDIRGRSMFTNNPPTGGYRGFGITQSCFAVESNLTQLAEKVGISPWEIRYRNAVVPGEELYNGQIADESTAVRETLLAVKDTYENAKYAGIAVGMKNCGSGSGIPDVGRCTLRVHHGHVWLHSAAGMCGQGVETILPQMAATASGLAPKHFRWAAQDTDTSRDTGAAAASRLTVLAGEATRRAALDLKERIESLHLPAEEALDALEGEIFCGEFSALTEAPTDSSVNPIVHVAYGYATHVAVLDEAGRVETIVAAHDVGRAIHPGNVAGQIEGGVIMSFGYALTEDFSIKNGIPKRSFAAVGFPGAATCPHVKAIIVEKSPLELALGAKGLGELVCIPTPAAIADAYRVYDGKLRTRLPLEDTPYQKTGNKG